MALLVYSAINMTSLTKELSRAERRRILRDPMFRNKTIVATDGIPEYYRLIAYGQVLVHQMSDIQARMLGIPYARGRRPVGARDELNDALAAEWEETIEKLDAVQKEIALLERIETAKEIEKNPHLEAELYGLC